MDSRDKVFFTFGVGKIREQYIWPQVNGEESSQECGKWRFGQRVQELECHSMGEVGERLGRHHYGEDLEVSQNWLTCSLPLPSFPPQGQTLCLLLFSVAYNTQRSTAQSVLASLIWSWVPWFILWPWLFFSIKKPQVKEIRTYWSSHNKPYPFFSYQLISRSLSVHLKISYPQCENKEISL